MFCPNCGKEVSDQAVSCPSCGHPLKGSLAAAASAGKPMSPHSRTVALILCILVGVFGVHRFFVGKIGTGIAMIFTAGGCGIWTLVDLIMIATGNFQDMEGRYVLDWNA